MMRGLGAIWSADMERLIIMERLIMDTLKSEGQWDRARQLLAGQGQLLEMIAKDAPLRATLDGLMNLIESQSPGAWCSVLLLDADGKHLRHGAAPSLPQAYTDAIDGIEIGATVGSCGTASYRKEQVVVTDIESDPLWAPWSHVAKASGLRACWSTPIMSSKGKVLGTFAMYYKEPRAPLMAEQELIEMTTHVAGIAIERRERDEEVRSSAQKLEALVEDRTSELRLAKEDAEMGNALLRKANVELEEALGALKATQEELVAQGKFAALGALVAGVSHELNTPIGNALTVASSMVSAAAALEGLLASGKVSKGALERHVKKNTLMAALVSSSCERAAELINSFKQVAVDQASEKRRVFDLGETVRDNMAAHQAGWRSTPWIFEVDAPMGIECDSYPGPVGQVVSNLLNNAVVHGLDGRDFGRVRVTAREQGEIAVVEIEDNGKGMDAKVLAHMFEPFFTTRMGQGGSGLGLSISKSLAKKVLGGELDVKSEPGIGSVFVLTFPKNAPKAS